MTDTDKIIGYVMAGVGSLVILIELIYLVIQPAFNPNVLGTLPGPQYWGLAIPAFIAIVGIFGIIVWIGVTMIKTPPPQEWEFEDIVEEEEEPAKEEKPKAKAKAKAKAKKKPAAEKEESKEESKEEPKEEKPKAKSKAKAKATGKSLDDLDGMTAKVKEGLLEAGYDTVEKIASASLDDLVAVKGIGAKTAERLQTSASE
ncbi:MAG: helix-hairpin-helix domain-containing protein [Candidatus Kariarchaeaceae archaeon]|jgi:cytoskeletal protein RodZ